MKRNKEHMTTKAVSFWPPRPTGQTDESTGILPIQKPPVLLNLVDIGFSYFPLLWVVLFVSFCLYATLLLGRWPVAYIDDPQWIGKSTVLYNWLDIAVWLVGLLLPIAVVAGVVIKARHKQVLVTEKQKIRLALFTLGVFLCIIIVFVDPFNRFRWFLD